MNRLALLALSALLTLALGCPKRATNGPSSSSDDELLETYAAQMEELRSRVQVKEPTCDEWRSLAGKACDMSRDICEIAGRHRDRADIQQRCVESQEDCARFNDGAAGCR